MFTLGLCPPVLGSGLLKLREFLSDRSAGSVLHSSMGSVTPVPDTELLRPLEFPGWRERHEEDPATSPWGGSRAISWVTAGRAYVMKPPRIPEVQGSESSPVAAHIHVLGVHSGPSQTSPHGPPHLAAHPWLRALLT